MARRANPYVVLAAAVVLVLVAVSVASPLLQAVLWVLGVAASVAAVVLLVRQARDPNGPPGQH